MKGSRNMRTVLRVDDDPNILRLISIHLTKAGYQVEKASNAEVALEVFHKYGHM